MSPSGPVTVSNADDGTLSVFSDEVLLFSGRWWIEDDQYCLDLPPVEVRACSSAVLDGTTLKLFEPEGALWMRFEVDQSSP